MDKHVVVAQRITGTTVIGPFDDYQTAEKYRNELVTRRRRDEDSGEFGVAYKKGGVAFFVIPLFEPEDDVLVAANGVKTECCCPGHGNTIGGVRIETR